MPVLCYNDLPEDHVNNTHDISCWSCRILHARLYQVLQKGW